jgi:hypothetical protein
LSEYSGSPLPTEMISLLQLVYQLPPYQSSVYHRPQYRVKPFFTGQPVDSGVASPRVSVSVDTIHMIPHIRCTWDLLGRSIQGLRYPLEFDL